MIFILFWGLNCHAAQLVDKIPSTLTENWSVCIDFKVSKTLCKNQSSPSVFNNYSDDITQILYRKELIISGNLHDSNIGIWLGPIDDVDEVRINNRLIGRTGHFPPQFESGFRYERIYLIPTTAIKYNQFNTLEIKTFSSKNQPGLGQQSIIIDDYFKLIKNERFKSHWYTACISILVLLILLQLFYFFMLQGGNETLYLALFLLSIAIIAFVRSSFPVHMGLDLSATYKTEIFMLSIAVGSFSLFIFKFFDLEIHKTHSLSIIAIVLIGLLNIILPDPLQARSAAEYTYWIICILSLLTAGNPALNAIKKRRTHSIAIASSGAIGWIFLSYDAVSQSTLLASLNLPIIPLLLPIITTIIGICGSLFIFHKTWLAFKGATYDHLTGTLLRPAFFQRLSEEIQVSQSENSLLFIAIIHIQEMQRITASYGQEVGNRILMAVGETLSKELTTFDLICHFKSDEFCITARVDSRQQAEQHLKVMHQKLSHTQQIIDSETELFIDSTIGGVIYNPDHHLSISQLIQDAYYGLAKAKNQNTTGYILLNNPTVTA